MPMKPRKGESQSDFMARCMHEVYGPDAPDDRTQEQAVAICFNYWRTEHGGSKMRTKQDTADDLDAAADTIDPEEGEDYDDYVDRCVDDIMESYDGLDGLTEDVATTLCEQRADQEDLEEKSIKIRAKPGTVIYRTHSEPVEGTSFVLSDETVDRMGEVITATGWNLDNFKRNPIALFNHRSDLPIGRWHDLAIKDGKLKGRLELAPAKTSPRIDEIRKLVEAGILRAVSVGFQSTKKEPIDEKADNFFGPFRYLKQELVECSLVSVPANPNALALAKSLQISPETINTIFAGSGKRVGSVRRRSHGGSARTDGKDRRGAMSLAQRIVDVQGQIVEKRDALKAHVEGMDDTNVSDADLELTQRLNNDIAQLEKTRLMLVESEKNLGSAENDGSNKPKLPIVFNNGGGNGGGNGSIARVKETPITSTIGKKELDMLDLLVRGATISYVAKTRGHDLQRARQDIYGDDEPTKFMMELVTRATSAPAMTSVTGWAAELVQQTWTAMMPTLMPNAILTRLAAKGLALSFGRAGRINIPTRSRTPSIAGSFVGEGQAIPVRQGAFTTQALTPKKMAVITTWTREMDEHSIPAIEGILRDAIQVDTSVAVDSVLIDANPATLIRPAGLLNGVAAITAATGGGLAALIGDIKAMIGALTVSTYGNVRTPVWLMNPTDMLSAGLASAVNTGIFPFAAQIAANTLANIPIIDSATIPAKTMVLIDAEDFVVADGGAPRFEISDQATLHMEDTAPLDLVSGSPGTVASPQRSLFQTDSLALRMVMPLNWLQRRPGTVAWVQNVTWS
jgi:HK97 family phage prohead protease/HK97 family phage major capsid protein